MQISPSAAAGSSSGSQPAQNQPNASIATPDAPLFHPAQLLEAVLKFQGSGYFALEERQALRPVCKGFKAVVDQYAPFVGLKLGISDADVSVALRDCSNLLPTIQKLIIAPKSSNQAQAVAEHAVSLLKVINPSLKWLEFVWNDTWEPSDSWGTVVMQHLLPRLTSLEELIIHDARCSTHLLPKSLAALKSNANLSTLRKLILVSDENITPEICDLAPGAWATLINLEYLEIRGTCMGLDKACVVFQENSLPKLKFLSIKGDLYGRNGRAFTFTGSMPQWPQLESLVVSGLSKQYMLDAITAAPWFCRLKKLTIRSVDLPNPRDFFIPSYGYCKSLEGLSNGVELESIVVTFVGIFRQSFTELKLPKAKEVRFLKMDNGTGYMDSNYTPINFDANFPAVEVFEMQVFGANIDKLIDLTAPPLSPALKSFALNGVVGDENLRTTLYTKWMPRLETVQLRFGSLEQMQHMVAVLKEQGAAAAPMWPNLSSLKLSLDLGTKTVEDEALKQYFQNLAGAAFHFPQLEEFAFISHWEYIEMPEARASILQPLFRATKAGSWAKMKKIIFDVEDWVRDKELNESIKIVWKGEEFGIDKIMAMEESGAWKEHVEEAQ